MGGRKNIPHVIKMFRKKGDGISGCNKITPANRNVTLTTTINGTTCEATAGDLNLVEMQALGVGEFRGLRNFSG